MKTDIVTDAQLAAFAKRSHELYRRIMEGTVPVERALAGLQHLIEGKYIKPPTSLADMLEAGHYDWVEPSITDDHFPVLPSLYSMGSGSRVFKFDHPMTTESIVATIRAAGFDPAPIEKLLAYAAENPSEQRKHAIVGLGSSWEKPNGHRWVPYLWDDDQERIVALFRDAPGQLWHEGYRFLAYRKTGT